MIYFYVTLYLLTGAGLTAWFSKNIFRQLIDKHGWAITLFAMFALIVFWPVVFLIATVGAVQYALGEYRSERNAAGRNN
jgi:hypothetical protein